jgi:hypothetical protein
MRKGFRWVWLAGGILLLLATGAGAQRNDESRTVVALGHAAVQGGNATAARDAAIQAGLLEAVTRVAIELLSPEVFSENFRRLNDTLLEKPDAFVQDFRVLSEAAASKQHRVLVQATITVKPIQDAVAQLGASPARAALPNGPITLVVEGTANLSTAVKFRKALLSTPGVESLQVKEMKPNATTLWVTYHGTPEDMAWALMAQPFDTFAVELVESNPSALKVALVPK